MVEAWGNLIGRLNEGCIVQLALVPPQRHCSDHPVIYPNFPLVGLDAHIFRPSFEVFGQLILSFSSLTGDSCIDGNRDHEACYEIDVEKC